MEREGEGSALWLLHCRLHSPHLKPNPSLVPKAGPSQPAWPRQQWSPTQELKVLKLLSEEWPVKHLHGNPLNCF